MGRAGIRDEDDGGCDEGRKDVDDCVGLSEGVVTTLAIEHDETSRRLRLEFDRMDVHTLRHGLHSKPVKLKQSLRGGEGLPRGRDEAPAWCGVILHSNPSALKPGILTNRPTVWSLGKSGTSSLSKPCALPLPYIYPFVPSSTLPCLRAVAAEEDVLLAELRGQEALARAAVPNHDDRTDRRGKASARLRGEEER